MNRAPGIGVLLLALAAAPLQAHNLIAEDSSPNSWSAPVVIADPQVSQVYYCELEAVRRQLWFRFTGKAGDRIWIQVGVPLLERFRGQPPRAAVVGPGLPFADLGFELPPDQGAVVLETSRSPRAFDEPVTGTSSWVWIEQEYTLPASGTWYVVAFSDRSAGGPDKLWMAVGTKERFGLGDLFRFGAIRRFVRKFHEVPAQESRAPFRLRCCISTLKCGGTL
jgi:hypothetical protein